MYVSHLILYLRCKFHGNIPNDCQDIANLLMGYFNLGHPVYIAFEQIDNKKLSYRLETGRQQRISL